MIKKIRVEQLEKGMYIHDMNCGWMQHPFVRNRFLVTHDEAITKVMDLGVQELYIDSEKGDDVPDAPTEAEVASDLQRRMKEAALRTTSPAPTVELREEIEQAKEIHTEAVQTVLNVMQNARMGKHVEVERVEPLVQKITESIFRNPDAMLIMSKVKRKDTYTFHHSVSVCALLISFLRSQGSDLDKIREIGIGGLLHDIGKMMIPEYILLKAGPLTGPEFDTMKMHVELGVKLLEKNLRISRTALVMVYQHHEHYDGSGYPGHLCGEKISLYGQIASIVDVYDAMTSDRVYRKAMDPTMGLRKLYEWSKYHFNEELVEYFVRSIGIYPVGTLVRLESGRLAVVIDRGSGTLLRPVLCVVYDKKRGGRLEPQRLDLSKPETFAERIVGTESPFPYDIDPLQYISGTPSISDLL